MRTMAAWVLVAVVTALPLGSPVAAEGYPARPIKMIIPFPPGGSNDVVGRLIATHLGEKLGQKVYIDNRGGAGGVIGTEAAANSLPDGYTLLIVSLPHAVNPWLYKLNFDPVKSFTPIALVAAGPNVLAVNPQLPVNSVKELIALAKQTPGKLEYASAGVGSFQHLGGELFKQTAGVDILHVPYKGGGPAMLDVISGHVKIVFSSLIQTTSFIQSGQLKALATGGRTRSPVLPGVPTVAEAGVPAYEATNWWGVVAPAGTPAAIVEKLYGDLQTVLKAPDVQAQFEREGAAVVQMSTAGFAEYLEAEIAKWGRVVKEGNIRAQ